MTLVGLKTVEMAEEGRYNTIFMDTNSLHEGRRRSKILSETLDASPSTVEEDNYSTKATMAGKELRHKQKLQLMQLVHLLRQIETQVNSSQNDILQTLADHRASIHKFFERAVAFTSFIHQSSPNSNTRDITLKLLRATFDRVRAALGSVEGGIEDLMDELGQNMCVPMVNYVKGLRTELASGTCPRLLAIVEDMSGAMKMGRLELEKARKKVTIAEERKLEAVSRLKELEEKMMKMKEYYRCFEAKNGSVGHFAPPKLLGMEEGQGLFLCKALSRG